MQAEATVYGDVGVVSNEELGLKALLKWINPTQSNRKSSVGRRVLSIGYFANVVDLGNGTGLAMTCDGVGTKILVAELLERYDTIGIDCVAMNVNDLICVGAEPVSMLDYIGVERARPEVLEAIGRGLHEGARQAGISIVGGEIAQLAEIIRGAREGSGLDLVGMCVGTVPLERVNTGQSVTPGDAILGFASSGVHSNGLTLARHALLEAGDLTLESHVDALGCTLGEELLKPTRIYVSMVRDLLDLPIKALVHITSDGFLNLARIEAQVGFMIQDLPRPQPIFGMIQERGPVSDAEMYRVFNMGVGFCAIVPEGPDIVRSVQETAAKHGCEAFVLGETVEDPERRVVIPQKKLIGKEDRFFAG